jgi:hypothetical protein
MTVNRCYQGDISGWSNSGSGRAYTLPDTAAVGDVILVRLTVGDDTEHLLIKTAASGSLVNGVDASTEDTRLFITAEWRKYICVKAGGSGDTDWVAIDGRIPCAGSMYNSVSDTGHFTDGTWEDIPVDAEDYDIGDINDVVNMYFNLRRAGEYQASVVAASSENPNDADNFFARITNDADVTLMLGLWQTSGGANQWIASNASGLIQIAVSDLGTTAGRVRGMGRYIDNTANGALNAGGNNRMTIHEVL